jgi:uncharacterized protein (DUF1684 family)
MTPPRAGVLAICLLQGILCAQTSYHAGIEQWRREREANLQKDGGWLSVAGLFWLQEGDNRVGPLARVGNFVLHGGKTTFTADRGVTVTSTGKPVRTMEMRSDEDILSAGDLSMQVLKRGNRYGIRLWDKNSTFRRDFTGLHWFPVDPAWRIQAKFVPYNPPKMIPIVSIIGDTDQETCPGYATFHIAGKEYRLEPVAEGQVLFFIFRDLTSTKETYPSGRFLYADAPRNGIVTLDFNKAYNPPCAFTPYATCPLPPPQNRLPLRIPVGELVYHSKASPAAISKSRL